MNVLPVETPPTPDLSSLPVTIPESLEARTIERNLGEMIQFPDSPDITPDFEIGHISLDAEYESQFGPAIINDDLKSATIPCASGDVIFSIQSGTVPILEPNGQ